MTAIPMEITRERIAVNIHLSVVTPCGEDEELRKAQRQEK
jgi:hypothetical protein